jgi:hypothetical protein
MAMDATQTLNGTYGQIFDANGNWLSNCTHFSAEVAIEKEEVKRAGTRWIAHKIKSLKGTGSLTGYKITTDLVEAIGQVADDNNGGYVTELIGKINDPENSFGTLRVRLKGVQFDKIDLLKFEVGNLVTEELSFSFEGYEYLDTLS